MAELLVRTVDKGASGDPYTDRHRSGRGCVICVMPDGHPWSDAERNAPHWRVIKLPGIHPELLTQFTASDLGYGNSDAQKLNRVMRRWAYRIDLDAFDALLADPAAKDDIEKRPVAALAKVLALRQDRPALSDPRVIGGPIRLVRVIG